MSSATRGAPPAMQSSVNQVVPRLPPTTMQKRTTVVTHPGVLQCSSRGMPGKCRESESWCSRAGMEQGGLQLPWLCTQNPALACTIPANASLAHLLSVHQEAQVHSFILKTARQVQSKMYVTHHAGFIWRTGRGFRWGHRWSTGLTWGFRRC